MARPRKPKSPPPSPRKAAATSLGEALLLATVCMVGLPVEVQVRDGSAYAGVFHTACVDGGYGVVLKKARKVANGKDGANVSLGAFVDTLVVLPDDLVQVIAKDFSLPTKDVCRTPDCDVVATSGSVKPHTLHVKDPKTSRTENVSPLKQVEKCSRQDQEGDISIGKNAPMPRLSWNEISNSATVGSKDGNATNSVLTTPAVASDVKTSQPANNSATKIVMSSKTTAKESKLNPCAKIFSPSFASSRPVLAAAPPVNSNYISNSLTEVPTGVPVFETNSVPGSSSLSTKVVNYNNLAPANYGISPQYVQSVFPVTGFQNPHFKFQFANFVRFFSGISGPITGTARRPGFAPIVGHNVARLDPARIGTPYHPMQVGSTYINPSPHPVVGGKFGPVVYVHPFSQDAMHGTPVISQGWSRPVLLNSYQARLQKFQGTAPVYVAPPVMATGNLPFVVPSPAPLVQPCQAIRPIMVPAASSMVPGKYM